jgi:hypothetical protein
MTDNLRREVLRRVAAGELSLLEANRLLADIEAGTYTPPETLPPVETVPPEPPPLEPLKSSPEVVHALDDDAERRMKRWQRWWILPFGVGVFITILGAVWMYQGYIAAGLGWRFWLSWFPFLFGLLLMVASWYSQTLPWVHIRVREEGTSGTNISLSFPIPIGLASWGLSRYKHYAPEKI